MLFDIDKNSSDRSTPVPNRHDQLPVDVVMAKQTLSTTHSPSSATTTGTRIVLKNNVILYYDDQNRIIRVDGFIPQLASYPVSITAVYGYDVYVDVLGLTKPGPN